MSTSGPAPNMDLTVSQVATDSGVAPSTIRFYEKHGLITSVRTAGNQRRFDVNAACRVKVVRVAQRIGMSVAEIADLLAHLPPDATRQDWQKVHDLMVAESEKRITELRVALADITSGRRLCELGR